MHSSHSSPAKGPPSSDEQLQLVSFTVGEELFAVDILRVQEINRMMPLTKVPQSPPGVEGVINLRGRIIPVLDLRAQFGFPDRTPDEHSRIIVMEIRGSTVGFVVDSVREVMRIPSGVVEPAPSVGTSIDSGFVRGVAKLDEKLLILLEPENLLSNESFLSITSLNKAA